MQVTAYKTHKIVTGDILFKILDTYLPKLEEKSIVAVTSKIVAICEGRIIKAEKKEEKDKLAAEEADYYLPREFNQYGFMITINHGIIVASAGIDESNGNGYFVLWPKDPQQSANTIREYLAKKFHLTHIGVIITDSRLSPLRWGVTGVAIAHSGFQMLNSYIGKPDIFGRKMHAEKSNIADSLATAAVAEMGEGDEQQPLAVITDVGFVHFQKRNPTQEELDAAKIKLEDDVFASFLKAMKWKKGKKLIK